MSITSLKKSAKAALKGKWLIAIGANVIIGVISGITSYSYYFMFMSLIFVVLPLEVGLSWFYLDIYDGKDVEIKQLFDGFKNYGKVLGTSLLVWALTLLWALLLIIPGIIKGISYSQALYIIRENPEIGTKEAIKESQTLMNGYKGKYLLTMLSFIGWVLAPVITLFIGILALQVNAYYIAVILFIASFIYIICISFYLTPYFQATMAGFYRELKNNL